MIKLRAKCCDAKQIKNYLFRLFENAKIVIKFLITKLKILSQLINYYLMNGS